MADHLRNQIRDAVATALTGLTTSGTRVYVSRAQDMQDANLPGLRIYTMNETIELLSMGIGRLRERTVELVVEACARANSGADDTIDDMCKEVEVALDADNTLAGKCKWIEPRRFEFEQDGEGDKVVAVGRITFDVRYYAAAGSPDTAH